MSDLTQQNRKVFKILAAVVLTMGGLAWAAVPFYDWFCRVTGYGGTTSVSETASERTLEQTVAIRFDANTDTGMPWQFRPMERRITIPLGETGLTFYEAYNPTDKPIAGTATYNVAPDSAGYHFVKMQCFCFTQQVLQPGERVEMPVTFYVDPEILNDRDAAKIHEITLSYTFYQTELPPDTLSRLATPDETGQTGTSN